jgi:hypothetical protein
MSLFNKKNQPINELEPPPMATADRNSREILRVWTSAGPVQLALQTAWKDPAAWGLALVDIARHAANAYAAEGHDREEVLQRIRQYFEAEWDSPTSPAEDLTPR